MEIKKKMKEDSSSWESAVWLNSLLNWTFVNLVDEAGPVHAGFKQLISEVLVDLRRTVLGHFIRNSELLSVKVGGSAPELVAVKVITGSSLKDPSCEVPLTIQCELDYRGTVVVQSRLETVFFGSCLQVETVLNSFHGELCFVIQDRSLHFCIPKAPKSLSTAMRIHFQTANSSYRVPLLEWALSSSFALKKAIEAALKFPKFTNQWYRAGPEQPPYPWDSSVRKNPELLYTWKPKHTRLH